MFIDKALRTMRRRAIVFLSLIIAGVMGFGWLFLRGEPYLAISPPIEKTQITINDRVFIAEVVSDPAAMARGLSGRSGLGPNEGMLFRLDRPRIVSFWMRDMLFSIDIIWIRDYTVIGVERRLPLPTTDKLDDLPRYQPPSEVNLVLEVAAGQADNIEIGDRVLISPKPETI